MGFIPSGPEVWVILVIILIVFGAGKLPEIGGAFGKGIREFRSAQTQEPEEDEEQGQPADAAADAAPVAAATEQPASEAETKSA